MADEDDSLSDAQLRDQLKTYGQNPGPITASTRGLWLKKLTKLKSGGVSNNATAKKAKNRRSIATSTPSRQQQSKLSGFSSGEDEFPVRKSAVVDSPSASARRRSAFPRVAHVKEENDSDSSVSVEEKVARPDRSVGRRRSLPRTYIRETKPFNTLPGGASTALETSTNFVNDQEALQIHERPAAYRKNSFEFEDEYSAVVKNREEVGTSRRISPRKQNDENSTNAARHTLQPTAVHKSTVRRRNFASDETDARENDVTIQETEQENEQDDEELELAFASSSSFLKSWRGPAFILFVAVLLMCLVGSYMSLWSNRRSEWPALPDLKGDSAAEKVSQEQVFKVLQCLHDKLALSAGQEECGYKDVLVGIKGNKVKNFAESCFSTFKEKLTNFEKLGIAVVNAALDEKYSPFFKIDDARSKKSTPVTTAQLEKITISSKVAVKPFTCRLLQAAQRLSKYILVIIIGLGIMLAVYYIMKRRWMMDDEDTRLMFVYVELIIETLRRHHDACQHDKELPAYLPIPHVRDMLIPPRERKNKARAWKKAVDFLGSTDSRIRVETQRISGEDFEVWRWIGVMTPNKKIRGASNHLGPEDERGKFWQGPAFDKLEKVVRMPIITPTPCLKIRYLHGGPAEKDEGPWDRHVQDALIEKCNENGANILHVYVDTKSAEGCVYVKCDSLESAGKAFRSVYGNWFDGRLVIVKFVTVARYHQRFPDSLTCVQPLKTSGKFPTSLGWNDQSAEAETNKQS